MSTEFDRAVTALGTRYRTFFSGREAVPFAVRSNGRLERFGPGEPRFTLVANNGKGASALGSLDLLAVTAGYLNGDIDLEGDFLSAIDVRDFFSDRHPLQFAWRFVQPLLKGRVKADESWIAEHYDYDQDFYLLWLDRRHRCYSQAIFERDDEPLEDAITRKLDFALDAVGAKPGDRVLDIGGGWGAFTEHAGQHGVRVTSLTISRQSERFLRALIDRETLPCEVRLEHLFRHQPAERYDAIVNLGVTEHLPDYRATLKKYGELLKPGGRIYLDASATRKKHGQVAFLVKYIYPGNGSLMCLHEYLAEVARSPFRLRGVWDDNHSYALTLRHWATNLDRAREEIERRWGKELYRKFQLYLWGAAEGHRSERNQAYRVVLENPG
ncbi:class I SAM-dependent methyltransferase [Longimicrobium sp.]|uniref:class I SAM-dependent methyltransferase n=1 Tax=Longimicrobium sp. TaxID=2029185 RepID=UPI002CC7DAE5|nr:class I SAM-dependent methyltransferase [Longimicrobium sp.]HSU15110.1 class I SAM-dependent methyltransferase [Longimicrobium sp.]